MALTDEQRREAVGLLAELLVDAVLKREGLHSGGGFASVMGSASGGVVPLPNQPAKAQRAA